MKRLWLCRSTVIPMLQTCWYAILLYPCRIEVMHAFQHGSRLSTSNAWLEDDISSIGLGAEEEWEA